MRPDLALHFSGRLDHILFSFIHTAHTQTSFLYVPLSITALLICRVEEPIYLHYSQADFKRIWQRKRGTPRVEGK